MKINIASKNPVKIEAIREVIKDYKFISNASISSLEVSSGVSEQPKSLEKTVLGAINRAKNSFNDCDYSFGIESGLIKVPYTKTGYMKICVCSIYDGKNNNIGLSCAFEFPPKVMEIVLKDSIGVGEAFYKAGLTKNRKISSAKGAINILTKGRMTRKDRTKQAIKMALIHLENPGLYL